MRNQFVLSLSVCLLVLVPFQPQKLHAQQIMRCATDELLESQLQQHPEFREKMARSEAFYQAFAENQAANVTRAACDVFIVPVVVHIIYDDALSNISDQQVQSQLVVLNQDYRHLPATPGAGTGVDTRIQFCLASKDPQGNASTGINRVMSSLTTTTQADEQNLKSLIVWDPTRYLNIWVVKNISSSTGDEILGYANPPDGPNPQIHGIVVAGKYFGTLGSVQSPYNKGRTATHEIGHFLGLLHTFGTNGTCDGPGSLNCLNAGDRVCDTPSEQDAKYGCPTGAPNTCVDNLCDAPDPIRNYMNYVDDLCMDQFTAGQVTRMNSFLLSSLYSIVSPANLIATGCQNMPLEETAPVAEFAVATRTACTGQAIQFTNQSTGCIVSYAWTFPGGTPATSSAASPLITYAQAGTYPVSLVVTNPAGSTNMTKVGLVNIADTRALVPITESFETSPFPPTGWLALSGDGKGTWGKTGSAGSVGSASVVMANYSSPSCNSKNDLITPTFSLVGATVAVLSFDYAYKARNVDPDDADQLIVEVSQDCGLTFTTTAFDKAGFLLTKNFAIQATGSFIPMAADWQSVSFNLQNFVGKEGVRIRFRCLSKSGQNLFLDNIQITGNVAIDPDQFLDASLEVYPNPFEEVIQLSLNLDKPSVLSARLLDIQGKEVAATSFGKLDPTLHELTWNLSSYAGITHGFYLLVLETESGMVVRKITR